MKPTFKPKQAILFAVLLAGIMSVIPAQAKKFKIKTEVLSYEQLIKATEASNRGEILFLVNGKGMLAENVKITPQDWVVFAESFKITDAKFLSSAPKNLPYKGVINICALRKKDDSEPAYQDGSYMVLQSLFGLNDVNSYDKVFQLPLVAATMYFTVEADGNLSSISYDENSDKILAERLTKVLQDSPKWIPAVREGAVVSRECVLMYITTNPSVKITECTQNELFASLKKDNDKYVLKPVIMGQKIVTPAVSTHSGQSTSTSPINSVKQVNTSTTISPNELNGASSLSELINTMPIGR